MTVVDYFQKTYLRRPYGLEIRLWRPIQSRRQGSGPTTKPNTKRVGVCQIREATVDEVEGQGLDPG